MHIAYAVKAVRIVFDVKITVKIEALVTSVDTGININLSLMIQGVNYAPRYAAYLAESTTVEIVAASSAKTKTGLLLIKSNRHGKPAPPYKRAGLPCH